LNFDVGEEYWVGISTKLGEDFDDPRDFNGQGMVLQWHYRGWLYPEVRGAQPFFLRFRDDQIHVHNEVLLEYMEHHPSLAKRWRFPQFWPLFVSVSR
jgi:hypothetical protein